MVELWPHCFQWLCVIQYTPIAIRTYMKYSVTYRLQLSDLIRQVTALERSLYTFGDYKVGWFKQLTLLRGDLIRQVSL